MIIRKTARSTEKIQAPFLFCNIFYDNHEILHELPVNDYHKIFVSGHDYLYIYSPVTVSFSVQVYYPLT